MNADRSQCIARRHGNYSAYIRYGCRCEDARKAHLTYVKRMRAGIPEVRKVSSLGYSRKVRALWAVGHSTEVIAAMSGLSVNVVRDVSRRRTAALFIDTARKVDQAYLLLSLRPGSSRRAMQAARRNGWVPALGWDDIDNDPEPPAPPVEVIDEVAIQRVLSGGDARILRMPEKRELFRIATEEKGWPPYRAASLLRWSQATLQRTQHAIGQVAA
jgi:hypothetical protein